MNEIDVLIWYLLGVNVISFSLMGIDKRKAMRKNWRVPERTFWGLGLLGGALGLLVGMSWFRHKTKHASFKVGVPFLLIVNIVLMIILVTLS